MMISNKNVMPNMICRAVVWNTGKAEFASVSTDTNNIIQADKNFGFLKPTNGVLTFSISNRDGEITDKAVDRAVKFALKEWSIFVPIQFKKVPKDGDIRIEFRSEDEDEILNSNTLAYMFYPLGGKTDGQCVINTRFYWTNHGNGVDMNKIDPVHYRPDSGTKGTSWDLDQVLRHEFGHGIFGLPHDTNANNIMSSNYSKMKEHLSETDILRARAKAGTRVLSANMVKRLLTWITKASDRDYN